MQTEINRKVINRTIAALLIATELSWTIFRQTVLHVPWRENLPLHISDVAFFSALFGLLTKKPLFRDLAYFAGVSTASLGLLFAHITEPQWIRWLAVPRFYLTHSLIVFSGLWLTVFAGHRPDFQSMLRCYGIVLVYGILLIPVNQTLGTNYFFTQGPPGSMPEWMHRLPQTIWFPAAGLFFLILFFLFWLPFARAGRLRT